MRHTDSSLYTLSIFEGAMGLLSEEAQIRERGTAA